MFRMIFGQHFKQIFKILFPSAIISWFMKRTGVSNTFCYIYWNWVFTVIFISMGEMFGTLPFHADKLKWSFSWCFLFFCAQESFSQLVEPLQMDIFPFLSKIFDKQKCHLFSDPSSRKIESHSLSRSWTTGNV